MTAKGRYLNMHREGRSCNACIELTMKCISLINAQNINRQDHNCSTTPESIKKKEKKKSNITKPSDLLFINLQNVFAN